MREPRKPRKSNQIASAEQRELLRKAHAQILTPLVRKQADRLAGVRRKKYDHSDRIWSDSEILKARLWFMSERVEYLPEGVPYKISGHKEVVIRGGTFVGGLNQPLIVVSDRLTEVERKTVARHEYVEWQRFQGTDESAGHNTAKRMDNPRLRKAIRRKLDVKRNPAP
ncbi:MAG TPA: hypothetical protein VJH23_05400 [archaeon]|nr:hypothetical protein [archaeon]